MDSVRNPAQDFRLWETECTARPGFRQDGWGFGPGRRLCRECVGGLATALALCVPVWGGLAWWLLS